MAASELFVDFTCTNFKSPNGCGMNAKKKVTGAAESNAGDDFHVLWTIRKALGFLDIKNNELAAIYLEGPSEEEVDQVEVEGDELLSIDLAEYFGAKDFAAATKVAFSQLKYSTRNPQTEWSLAAVCKGKKAKYKGSIIERLADTFKGYIREFGMDQTIVKLTLKLVSNRPINPALENFVITFIAQSNNSAAMRSLKESEIYKTLKAAAGLNDQEMKAFISILDFSDCGALSRLEYRRHINLLLANLTTEDDQYGRLHTLVWSKMMPESSTKNRSIVLEDILGTFNCSGVEDLFPAQPSFESFDIIKRSQTDELANYIRTHQYVCLHANGGMGKSTLARTIGNYLPEAAATIVFDCYGGGSYTTPSDKRYKHEWAVLQICNEMALACGTPLLLAWGDSPERYLRQLKKRLDACAAAITSENPDGLLILIIDAADNSITAAMREGNNECFVKDLVQEQFHPAVRLVVTARTHRVQNLNLPHYWQPFSVLPFEKNETEKHLKQFYPDATEGEIEDFHVLTKGIPRVQRYTLADEAQEIAALFESLKPNGKDLDEIMAFRIDKAKKQSGEPEQMESALTLLQALPRPVPVNYLAQLLSREVSFLEEMSRDLWHGLVYENDHFSFRDEDFETYLEKRYPSNRESLNKIANLFLNSAEKDEYASINLGAALVNAQLHNRLFEIVLNREFMAMPSEPVRNKELFVERTRLAMKHGDKLANQEISFQKLMVIAAEAAKTDKVLREVLINNADLTAAYGDIRTLQKIYFQSEQTSWYGPLHYKSAAIYARSAQSKKLADKHLQSAESWVDWRSNQPQDEMDTYNLTLQDLSYGAEAYLRLKGSKGLIKWLRRRWRSRELMIDVVESMLYRILPLETESQVQLWISQATIRSDLSATVAVYCMSANIESGIDLDFLINHNIRILKKKTKIPVSYFLVLINLCEKAVLRANDIAGLLNELSRLRPKATTYSPRFYSGINDDEEHEKMDILFRLTYLQQLALGAPIVMEDFFSDNLLNKLKSEDKKIKAEGEESKKEFERIYKYLMILYELRAQWFLQKIDEVTLNSKVAELGASLNADWELSYYARYQVEKLYEFTVNKILSLLTGLTNPVSFAETVLNAFGSDKYFLKVGSAIASFTSRLQSTRAFAAKLVWQIENRIVESPMSGPSKMEHFVSLTVAANNINGKVGKYYFDKIIETANDIDDSAFAQIRCIKEIAEDGIPENNAQLAYRFTSFVEYCKDRLYEYEDFPWKEAVQGVTLLDIPSGFATLCRWDHKEFIELQEYSTEVFRIGFNHGFIDPEITACLLCIYPYLTDEYRLLIKSVFEKLSGVNAAANKNHFVNWLARDIKLHKQQFRSRDSIQFLLNLIKDDPAISSEFLTGLQTYYDFLYALSKEAEGAAPIYPSFINEEKDTTDILPVVTGELDAASLNKAIKAITDGKTKYQSRQQIDDFLQSLMTGVYPDKYITQLDALIRIDEELISRESFEKALQQRFEAWDYYFEVREWKKKVFGMVLKTWIHEFIYYDHVFCAEIIAFAKVFGVDAKGVSEAIKTILPEQIEVLDGGLIYQLMQLVGSVNLPEQNEQMIVWMLERWKHPDPELSEGPWRAELNPPKQSLQTVGMFLRYMMGSTDKQVRWLASHVLLRMTAMKRTEQLEYILENQDVQTCCPFQYIKYPFYWMSAKLWLWLTITKLVELYPDHLVSLYKKIANEVSNATFPHALISHFRKMTATQLVAINRSLFSEGELEKINSMLVSGLPPITEKKAIYNGPELRKDRDELRFGFDFMDTVPYWYETPGRIFGLSGFAFAEFVDKVISETWQFTGDVHKDDHVKKRGDKWRSKDHGDVPRIEDLQTYYEFHGMFYVAEQLLSTHRMIKDGTWRRNFSEWVEGYALAWSTQWLSELNDPIPMDRKHWVHDMNTENWLETIGVSDFEKWTGIDRLTAADFFVVGAFYKRYFGDDHENIDIDSAFVSNKTANALLIACQTAKYHRDYSLPDADDNDRVRINNGNFKLTGFTNSISNENRGIDSDDPFADGWQKYATTLGKDFLKYFNLEMSKDFKEYRKKGTGELCAKFESWTNVRDRRSHAEFETQGKAMSVSWELLLTYLKHKKCSLLLECQITKWKSGGRSGTSDHRESTKLFLIQENGTIKSFSGNHSIR